MPRQVLASFALTWSLCHTIMADEPKANPPARSKSSGRASIVTERVKDPRWLPAPGDRLVTERDVVNAARTRRDFEDFATASGANDREGIEDAYAKSRVLKLPRETHLLILRDHGTILPGESSTMSSRAANRSFLAAQPLTRSDGDPIEVRVVDGPHADKSLFVSRLEVARTYERRVLADVRVDDKAIVQEPSTLIAKSTGPLYDHRYASLDGDLNRTAEIVRSNEVARLDGGVKVLVLSVDGEFCRVKVFLGSKLNGHTGFVFRGDLIPPTSH